MQKIAIYKTDEGGAALFHKQLQAMTAKYNVDIRLVTAQDISSGILEDEVSGLVVPGRSRGQYYRDELGDDGFQHIQSATQNGMAVLAVCAGSYILSAEAAWNNSLDRDDRKNAQCAYPIFKGRTVGPLAHLWENGYQANGTNTGHMTLLSANIVNVKFSNVAEDVPALYWGGGAFEADASQDCDVLARHSDDDATPAVIEFSCGHSRVIFSNIHPEISAQAFQDVFRLTEKASRDPSAFQRECAALAKTADSRAMILSQFLHNSGLKIHENSRFPVLQPIG
jgi:glutamine amidotransferase-like uncharacterized protein